MEIDREGSRFNIVRFGRIGTPRVHCKAVVCTAAKDVMEGWGVFAFAAGRKAIA